MKHLYIKQNNNVEIVSSDIIEKLYQISQGEGLDSTSDLIGNLQCTHAYDDAVTYLTTKFKNLQINVTGGAYIRFADSNVLPVLLTYLTPNDGVGITTLQAATAASIGNVFAYNTSIVTFNELVKFTSLTYIDGHTTGDARGAFRGCTSLQSIVLPNSVTLISPNAFRSCTALTSINLQNVTSVKNNAFQNCSSLALDVSTIVSMQTVLNNAFSFTKLYGELSLPNLTGVVGGFAHTNITKVLNLGSATTMCTSDAYHEADASFAGCSLLTEVILPDTMISIGGMSNCQALVKCLFTNSVTSIGQHTFDGDTALTTVGDCSGVVSIGNTSFAECLMLQSINLSTVCKTIDSAAFKNCKALTSIGVSIESSLITVIPNDCFAGCNALITVGSLQNILTIGYNAFNSCYVLGTTMNLSSCTSIGECAFQRCYAITSVTLNTNITSLGSYTFNSCTSLTTIDL